jgi:hypothetical protein
MIMADRIGERANSKRLSRAMPTNANAMVMNIKHIKKITAVEISRVSFSAAVSFAFSIYSSIMRFNDDLILSNRPASFGSEADFVNMLMIGLRQIDNGGISHYI